MQSEENPYLTQEVLGASPIRLRWMLIRRASELCSLVETLWQDGENAEAGAWMLRIREILGELLGGVQDASNPLGKSVADFYVYLLKLLTETERSLDAKQLNNLKMLLDIEQETWRQVMLQEESPVQTSAERFDSPRQSLIPHVGEPRSSAAITSLNLEV